MLVVGPAASVAARSSPEAIDILAELASRRSSGVEQRFRNSRRASSRVRSGQRFDLKKGLLGAFFSARDHLCPTRIVQKIVQPAATTGGARAPDSGQVKLRPQAPTRNSRLHGVLAKGRAAPLMR